MKRHRYRSEITGRWVSARYGQAESADDGQGSNQVSDEKQPCWVNCGECKHSWVAAYVPMEMRLFAKVVGALHCPKCGANAKKVFMGRGTDLKVVPMQGRK